MNFNIENKAFNNIKELTKYIKSIMSVIQSGIISVDGKDGSGKTYVSDYLSKTLHLLHLELDKFIKEKKDQYVDFIDYEKLVLAIKETPIGKDIIVIDGVCVLSVLQRLDIKPKCTIYVKRTNNTGYWYDENYFNLDSTPEKIIKNDDEETKKFLELMNTEYIPNKNETIFHEIIKYHFDYKPHIKSDIIFENAFQNSL